MIPPTGTTHPLPCRTPYEWPAIHAFLAARAIPGVEAAAPGFYARTVSHGGRHGTVSVAPGPLGLSATTDLPGASLPAVLARLRRLFDCGTDPVAVGAHLAGDPRLSPPLPAGTTGSLRASPRPAGLLDSRFPKNPFSSIR